MIIKLNRFESSLSRKTLRRLEILTGALTLALIAASLGAYAQGTPIIYPAKGQSTAQQDQDRYQCHDWARGQSGFDPTQPGGSATARAEPSPRGPSLPTVAVGAAGGAAIAELSDHSAGKGAAAGALGALAFDRMRAGQSSQARQQQAAEQQAARRSTYERAFGACLEARGYVVK